MLVRLRVFGGVLAAVFLAGVAVAGELPRPSGLEPEIGFWRRIFAEVSTRQGLIHDNRHLEVVYERIDLAPDASPGRIRQAADAARQKYERILRRLAEGRRSGLSGEEARVLALWGKDVDNRALRAAAERVRFQQGLSDRFYAGLLRSGQWREHIIRSLRAAGVPEELVALPHVESSFDPGARSFVGAAGLWQFTAGTGKRFMRIDQAVDERRDPFASSEAAARLLRYNHDVLGSWPLAITAYNHGAGGMRRAAQAMGTDDIEVIIHGYDGPAFGFASRNFYVSFLAALEIEQAPEKFFGPVRREAPAELLIIEVPDYLGIDALEKALGVSRSTLQTWNPALLPPVWQGAKYVPRGFRLRLPAETPIAAAPAQLLAAIPPAQRFGAQVPDKSHVVRRGDTLSHIARRYGTTVAQLARANNIRPGGRIRIGQRLVLPQGGSASVARAATAAAASAPPAAPSVAPPMVRDAPAPAADPSDYGVAQDDTVEVQAAETLSHYAEWLQVSAEALRRANGWPRQRALVLGQRVRLVFDQVARDEFTARRNAFHSGLQQDFFSRYRVADVTEHRLRPGESVWLLAAQKYKVPVWLLRQYNPQLNLDQVRPGTRIVFPRVERLA
jgi:membrane-bound lytic murein transglycosylase D